MRVYCRGHETLFDPLPSGYWPTHTWACPEDSSERVSMTDILNHVGPPGYVVAVVYVNEPAKQRTRLIGIPPGPGYRP